MTDELREYAATLRLVEAAEEQATQVHAAAMLVLEAARNRLGADHAEA